MDSAPLIKAHDHARAASIATHSADTTVAINEHTLAAGEFSNAAKSTTSIEALRTLALLEQHHRRLSELLKHPFEPSSQQSSADGDIPEQDETESQPSKEGETKGAPRPLTANPPTMKPLPTLANARRYPTREMTSSIASNLASARGIKTQYRGQALTPSVSNDFAPGNLEVHPRKTKVSEHATNTPSWVPPAQQCRPEVAVPSEPPKREQPSSSQSEEGFSRFYSTFGSLINRLSAPLAFAGLPLIVEETPAEPSPESSPELVASKRRHQKTTSVSSIEPDLHKIYSKATLKAFPGTHGPADSFYVVPTSGHTATYASILNHETKEKRRLAASIHHDANDIGIDDEDDFVDARESQPPLPSINPSLRKRMGKSQNERELQNVIEELHLENTSLKEMLDKLSKRLHAFELNSQSSHLALAQSLRLQRPGSPMTSSGGAGGGSAEEALRKRNQELEEQLQAVMKQMLALEKDHDRLQQTVEKYRDRWEKLKAGAKARREAAQQDQPGG
ncbi:hypothetical protein V8F20_011329 [Naviculisporaceae sp. PSN 640]